MTAPRTDAQGFTALWPTTLLQRRLPGHELANKELGRLILELDTTHDGNLTTDYREANFLTLDNPAVAWLRDCVNKTVIDFLRHQQLDYEVNWQLQGWPNVNRFADYHDLHNHPHAYLSGTYYVAVPKPEERVASRPDARPGRITFYDPRGAVNMSAIRGDGEIEQEYTLDPAPGTILLWPAFLFHFVHPNLAREPRISISFNVLLKRSGNYLPAQD